MQCARGGRLVIATEVPALDYLGEPGGLFRKSCQRVVEIHQRLVLLAGYVIRSSERQVFRAGPSFGCESCVGVVHEDVTHGERGGA